MRSTLRQLGRRRASTGLSLGLLTIGVGLFVSFYSVLDRALLSGLPFPSGERMVAFSTGDAPGWPMPLDDFRAIEAGQVSLEWTSPLRSFTVMLSRGDQTKGLIGSYVPVDLFGRLGVTPVFGRSFEVGDEDPGNPSVVLISHRLWHGSYGADPGVLGEEIVLNREPSVVVGVMPPGFNFPLRHDVWGVFGRPGREWSEGHVFGVGVLAADATVALAREDLARVASSLDEEQPLADPRFASLDHFVRANLGDRAQGALRAMVLAALGLLALTCANVANLRLSESLRRRGELDTRLALGAKPRGLVELLLFENLVLGLGASALGLSLAFVLTETLGKTMLHGGYLERIFWIESRLDGGAAGIAVACAVIASLLGAVVPIVAILLRLRSGVLGTTSATRTRTAAWPRVLVSLQVGLCFALLVAAGLWSVKARELLGRELGFRPDGLSSIPISTYQAGLDEPEDRRALLDRVRRDLTDDSGVAAVAFASASPWGYVRRQPFGTGETPNPATAPRAGVLDVSSGFFDMLALPLRTGRTFTDNDMADHPVAIVSRSLAERFYAKGALDRELTLAGRRGEPPRRLRIIGVVDDVGLDRADDGDPDLAVYLPASAPSSRPFLIVRRQAGVVSARSLVEGALARVAPLVGTFEEQDAVEALSASVWVERRLGQIFSLFGLAALLVTAGGVYAVIAVMVRSRERELGIRSAVGARPADLQHLVLGESARQLAIGLAIGMGALWAGTRFLDSVLLETVQPSLLVLAGSGLLVVFGYLAGSWVPTQRAAQVDPARCLRSE